MNVVFFDRDGVLNQYPGDGDYVKRVKDLYILPNVFESILRLQKADFKVFIISNQACVGRGIISQKKLDQITNKLLKSAKQKGVKFDGVFYCIHHPDEKCFCRKPEIGNIKKALASRGTSLAKVKTAFFIGDTDKDIKAGYNAGIQTILIETGRDCFKDIQWGKQKPHYVVSNLQAAVDIILNENSSHSRNSRRRA